MDAQVIEEGFKRVWDMFQETNRQFKEIAERSKETDRQFKEIAEQSKETSRQFKEIAERSKETDRQFKETDQRFKETDRQFKETDRKFKESDDKFNKYFGKIKELDRNWGKLVEALIRPSVGRQFRKWGIPVDGSGQRMERERGGETIEIDILLTNGDTVVAVEVKTRLNVESVDEHIEKHLKPFKRFFPEYRDKKVCGAVAFIHVEEDADRYAYKKGLFVLSFTTGDMVEILNDNNFTPRIWNGEPA